MLSAVICLGCVCNANAATYYVDARGGNDGNSGLSSSLAWRTVGKVNGFSFSNGDIVLFKRGETFDDDGIYLTSTMVDSFTIGAYGSGDRPWIDGNANQPIYIQPSSQKSDLTIENIDISGQGWQSTQSSNIQIYNIEGIHIDNVYGNGHKDWSGTTQPKRAIDIRWSCGGAIEIENCELFNWGPSTMPTYGPAYNDTICVLSYGPHPAGTTFSAHDNLIHDINADAFNTYGDDTATYEVYDNTLYNCGEEVIDIKGCSNVSFHDNTCSMTASFLAAGGMGGGGNIDMPHLVAVQTAENSHNGVKYGANDVKIYDNTFTYPFDGTQKALQIWGDSIAGVPGIHGLEVYGNLFTNCGWAAYVDTHVQSYDFYNNLLVNSSFHVANTFNGTVPFDTRITDNTIYGGSILLSMCEQTEVRNNVVYCTDPSSYPFSYGRGTVPVVEHNVWHNSASDKRVIWAGTSYNVSDRDSWAAAHPGEVFQDPAFIDPATGDFRLQSGSPALDAGTDTGLTVDFDGDPVPQGDGPDIGAFETPSTGGTGDDPPSTGGTDDPPSTGGTDDPPSTGGTDDPPSTGGTDDPPSTGGTDDPPSTGGTGDAPASTDNTPPTAVAAKPEVATQVPRNSLITLQVSDAGSGVDEDTVTISVNGASVYTGSGVSGNTPDTTTSGVCRRTGTKANYRYDYQAATEFDFGETITVRVNAADTEGNVMAEYVYSFTTEMWALGANQSVGTGPQGADMGSAATACDSTGNIWVAWHAGAVGQRDIYVSTLVAGYDSFAEPIQLTTNTGDQSYPDIAIDANDTLYVVWQDNRRGNWDIYIRTSANGVSWSAETRIDDSDDNQTAPAVAVNGAAGCHVAWEDDRGGHQDIFVTSSSDGFASPTVSARVTFDASDPTDPDIAVDASGNVYLVWMDGRNGTRDIYGTASSSGSWANVAVVMGSGNQNAPALATEEQGTQLHLVWGSDRTGNGEVYYATTQGMPSSPVSGINLVDDTSGADQGAPSLATTGSTGAGLRVFVCWQDWRNATTADQDADLYFVEVGEGDETNVLVGDGGTGSNQGEPALGVNSYGYPYVVWTDDRAPDAGIYYAGTTFEEPEVLETQTVTASQAQTVGVASPSDVDDVSVAIPAGALSQDVTVTIKKIRNPQLVSSSNVLPYEFGPSGLEFAEPVTITIPYAVADVGDEPPSPWWYDSQTGSLSQEGITDIEDVVLMSTLHAVRFKTTHFTPYYLLTTEGLGEAAIASGAIGGAGGCSLSSAHDRSDPVEYFVPYALLALIMVGLRLKDARRRMAS